MMGANFSPLVNYIHATGYVKIASKSYRPLGTVITGDMRRALDMMGANFSPLVNYIHAIGYVKIASKSYRRRRNNR